MKARWILMPKFIIFITIFIWYTLFVAYFIFPYQTPYLSLEIPDAKIPKKSGNNQWFFSVSLVLFYRTKKH